MKQLPDNFEEAGDYVKSQISRHMANGTPEVICIQIFNGTNTNRGKITGCDYCPKTDKFTYVFIGKGPGALIDRYKRLHANQIKVKNISGLI